MHTYLSQMKYRFFLSFAGLLLTGFFTLQTTFSNAQSGTESTFFLQSSAGRAYAMCPSGDGNLYLAGQRNELLLLAKMNKEGEFLFSYLIDLSLGPASVVAEIIVDSEGKIVGCGNFEEDTPGNGFIFRFDPATASLIWVKTLEGNNTIVNGIIEETPGGNFLVYNNPQLQLKRKPELLRVFRNNGTVVPGSGGHIAHNAESNETINAMTRHDNAFYAVGQYYSEVGNKITAFNLTKSLSKFDANTGQVLWSRLIHPDTNKAVTLSGRDVLVDQDAIISTFSGNDNGETFDPSFVFLQKTSTDGEILWVKKYDLAEWNTEFAEEIVSVSDGYVLLGRTLLEEDGWLFLLKTDKNGDPQWAYKFSHEYNNDLIGTAQGQLLALDNYLYFTGYTEHVPANSRIMVVKLDANGLVSPNCNALAPTPVTVANVLDPVNYTALKVKFNNPTQSFDITKPVPTPTTLTKLFICRQDGMDDCQNMVDWELTIDGLTCDKGKLSLHYKLCNNGGTAATDSVPVSFYLGNPTATAAPLLGTYLFDGVLAPGECKTGTLDDLAPSWFPNGLSGVQTVYAVVNDNQSLTAPFSLDAFPVTNLLECDYSNNLSFTVVAGDDLTLDLGLDVILCEGTTTTFNAGSQFYQYLWQDGSTDSTFTATQPGTYWVEATDVCGFKQRDSVFFSYSLLPDTQFPDSAICPGSALVYSVPGFDTYSWAPAAGLSCTNCATVSAQPSATTQYTLMASDSSGCVLTDTFVIAVRPNPVKTRVYQFCPGESVTINGTSYSQPGTVLDTLPSTSGGCDTLATYTLQFVPLPQPSVVTIQCPASLTVTIPANANTAVVNYASPTATSDCPCGNITPVLEQGLASGSAFPADATLVCYTAKDDCGTASSCCFTVTVNREPEDEVCDEKITPCIKFEILGIFQNPAKQRTYRMRVTNTCTNKLAYVAYELPDAFIAEKPADNTIYAAPSGRQYSVRNANYSPFRSIRFKASGDGIANGQSDIFEYTLPPQSQPTFIHTIVRLEPQIYYETHLNVFACEVQQTPNRPEDGGTDRNDQHSAKSELRVYPNPASDRITVDVSNWKQPGNHLRIFDLFGRVLFDEKPVVGSESYKIDLPSSWPTGVYLLEWRTETGERQTLRFVKNG